MSEWRDKQVKELGEIITGRTPSTARKDFYDGDYNLISPADLDNGKYIRTAHKTLTKLGFDQCRVLPKGTVLVGCIGNVGKLGIAGNDQSATNQQINALICNQEHDHEFVYYCFQENRDKLEKRAVKTTVPILNKTNFGNFEVSVPPLPEQKKIAHILSTVQRAIEAQERIIQTTTELKKALMQKLFTEGLRNEPQKQTEIGLVPESWEVVELGSLAKVGNGSTPKRANEAYWEGGTIPWLNSTKIHDRFITEADQFVTPQAVKECHLPRVAPNSLLIAITGQGKTLGNSAITRIETCINQHLAYAQFHAAKIVPDFVLWFMQTRYDYLRAIAHGGGSTKGALTCGFLKTLPIPVPQRTEQEEIATTFQTLEDKQDFAVRKQAALQDLFRTLLHELMTAKIRAS
ncbi:hypothetical protein BURK2_00489 [Burkholderiales bacterium]|nr:MAG: hypothetical protein F9K47_08195 [Burkholderiales bacterium]CAG0956357.1 hypothetical protein BURK2_00489 [Burkholderiales bacterium]